MFKTRVACRGLSEVEGVAAPADILEEFTHRPWHKNVRAGWNDNSLWLEAMNDYDADGQALLDEFWDVVIACVDAKGTISFNIEDVAKVSHG